MPNQTRGLVIAGTQSGVGKTSVTLGILAALRRRGLVVQPFKVGPDFIDPGHHTRAAGRLSRNLDGWMLTREANLALFRHQAQNADVAVVEGVMGLFDGYDGLSEAGSTAQMAKWLGLPVLLVVDARALARSAAALVHGFADFDPDLTLAGVIFNRIGSATHLDYLQQALSSLKGVCCFGGLPRDQELAIPERHLGLTTTEDHPLGEEYLNHLADWLEAHLDLNGLLEALPRLTLPEEPAPEATPPTVRLGIARDRAFCFYYPENLELLADSGAELVPFSPLEDRELPTGLHGIYLGGGYPELYAAQLAANSDMRKAIRERAAAGLPIYAECGGLMYLAKGILDLEGQAHPMAGVFPFTVRMPPRLKALGYREVTMAAAGLLGSAGTTIRGHEFHYSEMVGEPTGVPRLYRLASRKGGKTVAEGYCEHNVLASYVHLHFGSNPEVARNLVASCRRFKDSLREGGGFVIPRSSPQKLLQRGENMDWQPRLPAEIEAESFRRIEAQVGPHHLPPEVWFVVRRMIHTTADPEYLISARIHPQAIAAGVEALKRGNPVATDTRMLLAGISTGRLGRLGAEAFCLMDDPEVATEAQRRGTTRAAVALERSLPSLAGGIVAIGNAPTALLRLLELLADGAPRPALVVGVPVGFVNAAESKVALARQDCPYITALGPKGGSAVAASIINALAIMALEETPS